MPPLLAWWTTAILWFFLSRLGVVALRYDPDQLDYNLNQNQSAVASLDYWGEWRGHTYHPSPVNWRFPFYTLFIDRFVNGDPTNDDINVRFYPFDSPQPTPLDEEADGLCRGLPLSTMSCLPSYGMEVICRGWWIAWTTFMGWA